MKKVLGLGNALVDIMTRLSNDAFLEDMGLQKGTMQLVDKVFSGKVYEKAQGLPMEQASGGSAANTIHGLAQLGVGTGFIGKVGDDSFGRFFSEDMKTAGITPLLLKGHDESGRAMALISKDGERTFATFLGAAIELCADDLQEDLFEGYDYFHIEGYLVQNYELIEKAVSIARKKGMVISLDLASFNVVEQHKDFLLKMVDQYVDIVFANEDEARAFTGHEPAAALESISAMCKLAIVKTGKNGSLVKQGHEKHAISAIEANCIDTTGAGDLYASGFLYGLATGRSLDICGAMGSLLAGNVVELIGAKINSERWQDIKEKIALM
jgi:sugar/nucleoside kinase (ribokinase family)